MTDSEQLERASKECEEKFSKAFRQAPLVLTLSRAQDHRYIDVNETFERITGWKRDEVIGRTPFDLDLWVNPNLRLDCVKELLSGERVRNREFRIRMKNNEVRTAVGSADLIEINGEQCVLCMAVVSDPKPAPEFEQFAMAGRLIQTHDEERVAIARELHEYVDRLSLLSTGLARLPGICMEPADEVALEISRARQHIEDLVSDIQTLSRRLHYSMLDHLGLPSAAANFCRERSDQNQLEIDFRSEGLPKDLPNDVSFCVFQVLREVLNAVEHSGSRKIRVSLRVEWDEIHLTVRGSEARFDPDRAVVGSGLRFDLTTERLRLVGGDFRSNLASAS